MEAYFIAIGIIALIYVILSLGLTLQYGLTGLINFGHVGFFAIGAYTSALLALKGVPLIFSFAAAAALAGLAAWPLGLVSLRLRDDYFAIVTLGFSEVVRIVITSERWLTNGVQGIPGIPRLYEGLGGSAAQLAVLVTVLAVTLVGAWIIRRIAGSPFGRLIEAIRDNEEAAASVGVRVVTTKRLIFVFAAFGAGLAGALWLATAITFQPKAYFSVQWTAYMIFMVLVGGIGTFEGAILGAVLFFLIETWFGAAGVWYLIGLGGTALVFALVLPKGIWGFIEKRTGLRLLPVGYRLDLRSFLTKSETK